MVPLRAIWALYNGKITMETTGADHATNKASITRILVTISVYLRGYIIAIYRSQPRRQMWPMLTYKSVVTRAPKCSHALFAASKSYSQTKRKRRNDNKEKSDIAKLAKIELLGLCLMERVPQITKQTEMLPSKFAKKMGSEQRFVKQ